MLGYGLKSRKKISGEVLLKEVGISGNICGEFGEISIKQVYENKGANNIDGIYTFSIPDTAVITGFEAALGGRTIKALVEDKKEAKRIYDESSETEVNALSLEQPYSNVYQFSVGQILPGESVKIKFSYIDMLVYEENSLILTIPQILYPRHMDYANKDADNDVNSPYKSSLNLLIEPLSKISIECPTHKINLEYEEDINLAKVTFDDSNMMFDKDFILILREAESTEAAGMIYKYMDESDNKGILYLRLFPKLEAYQEDKSSNYIFLIDISDSMKGHKLEEAKNALQICIRNLSEGDYFNIVAFESRLQYFSHFGKVPFNEENLRKATDWIDNLQVQKGSAIFEAIKYALSEKNAIGFSTIFLFTDDIIKNEEQVLQYVSDNIGDNRIFTFGIDTSVNSYVINKLAQLGYGKAEFINESERIDDVVLKQFSRIESPQVDIEEIDWGTMRVEKTYPRTIDYLYNREPFSIFAKVSGEIEGKITIKGKIGGEEYIKTIDLDGLDLKENAELIQKVWGRRRINSIAERMRTVRGEDYEAMRNKVIEISKEYGIVSDETSFIMLEIIEDPVLGMPITHIVPLNVSEETQKNITRANFLEVPTFIYRSAEIALKGRAGIKNDNSILDLKYSRNTILKIIAKNQFADGSFVDSNKENIYNKLETTSMVLLAFTEGKDDITIYLNQINKALRFLLRALENEEDYLNERLLKLSALAIKSCIQKGILKDQIRAQCDNEITKLKNKIEAKENGNEKLIYILNSSEKVLLKNISPIIFNVSADGKTLQEKITIGKDKNSIYNLAKLGLLKSI